MATSELHLWPGRNAKVVLRKFTMVPHFLQVHLPGGSVAPSPSDGAHGYRCPRLRWPRRGPQRAAL